MPLLPSQDNQDGDALAVPAGLSGYQLLSDARLNKGTAFTDAERDAFGLHGLLPPMVANIDDQVMRRLAALRGFSTDLERYAFLRPFPPLKRNGPFRVDQTNNSYIFPGVGLGAVATRARRITDSMFMAAAKALAALSPARNDPAANLLPPVTALREVATEIAVAVGRQAYAEGHTSGVEAGGIEAAVRAKMWTPRYRAYQRAGANA